ncbi:MAG: HD domain-containing protein [Firmicutes bacterium]|nr:HD domain-containing protein [Bacillota bacterium]
MDFSKKLIRHFYQDTNLQLARICRIMTIFLGIVMVLNWIGIFKMNGLMYPVMLLCICVLMVPTVLYNYLHKSGVALRLLVLTIITLMSGLLYAFLSYHVIIMLAFPMLIACLYCDKPSVMYTAVISAPTLIASHLAAFYLHMVPDEPLVTLHGVICYGILPRLIELAAIFILCYKMTGKITVLVNSLVAKNNVLYEDQLSIINALSQITTIESRETGEHNIRVSHYTRILCEAMGMDEVDVIKVSTAAMMHDVGKIAVPKEILEKPGKLTDEEYSIVKTHVTVGRDLLKDSPGELMQLAAAIAYEHHERWDGTGYLHEKGDSINLYARCVAVGDVFDALVTPRPYKEPWPLEAAKDEILAQRGKQFDPHLVDLFEEHFDEFVEVYHKYS